MMIARIGKGAKVGNTREKVRQIQIDALKRLKDMIRDEGLDEDELFN